MDVTPLITADAQVIQSYKGGVFKISAIAHQGATLVSPKNTAPWSAAEGKDLQSLTLEDFSDLTTQSDLIDVVLLGTGARMAFLPHALKRQLKEAGLAVEVMDTPAACRTFNVLMAEGRRVVAALLPVV